MIIPVITEMVLITAINLTDTNHTEISVGAAVITGGVVTTEALVGEGIMRVDIMGGEVDMITTEVI
jgi:hypothetical protein